MVVSAEQDNIRTIRDGPRWRRKGDPLLGKILGDFKVEEFLGRGGMATVYLARQISLDRQVAVKILSPNLMRDAKNVELFFREAKTLAKLEHPNIVPIYNVGQEDEHVYLVMQLLRGGTLGNLLQERKLFPHEEATSIIRHVAEGLREAHDKGIIHRDIKPDNVLVAPGPTYKISDFGLALVSEDNTFTQTSVVGTPHYISPEQVDSGEVDARSDIYSLGATFYHLLVGAPPFEGSSTINLLLKHLTEPPVPPHERNKSVPLGISKVVCRMLEKVPADRYPSTAAFLEDLLKPEVKPAGHVIEKRTVAESTSQAPKLLLSGKAPALADILEPVKLPQPAGIRVAGIALVILAGVLIGVGIDSIKAVLNDIREESEVAEIDEASQAALDQVAKDLQGLESPQALKRYQALAAECEGTPLGKRFKEQAAAIQARVESRLAKRIEGVEERRKQRELGPALDLLHDLDQSAERVSALTKTILSEVEVLGFAWVPGAKGVSLGEGGHTRLVSAIGGFYIQLREVTRDEFRAFLPGREDSPAPLGWIDGAPPKGTGGMPVTGVNLEEAMAYAKARGMRIATSDEWERAARGDELRRWPWGAIAKRDDCNWGRSAGSKLLEPGSFPRDVSPFGCLDMAGNAAELTLGPKGKAWVRGGSYLTKRLENTRASFFVVTSSKTRHPGLGFRCAADKLPPPSKDRGEPR